MRLRTWEIIVAVLGLLLAALLALDGDYVTALAFAAATAAMFVLRARATEPTGIAGGYARRRARLALAQLGVLVSIYVGVIVAVAVAARDNWATDTRGRVAVYSLAAFAFLLLRELRRLGDTLVDWRSGWHMEAAVGKELDPLRTDGWLVVHDFPKDWGNIDHVVIGKSGVYSIETKSGKPRRSDVRQAAGNAAWLKERLGVPWVTAVLCRKSDKSGIRRDGAVWIVPLAELRPWLTQMHGRSTDTERVAEALAAARSRGR